MLRDEEVRIQERLNRGDASALELLFHRYYNDLCRYLILLLKDSNMAENIVQDLFLNLWNHRSTIEFKHSIESYLYQASRFNALIYLRNEKNKEEHHKIIGRLSNTQNSEVIDKYEFEELNRVINEAITFLPERCREIFILSRKRGMSYLEIAIQLGISESTVENQISRAIKKIKIYIRKQYPTIYTAAFLINEFTTRT